MLTYRFRKENSRLLPFGLLLALLTANPLHAQTAKVNPDTVQAGKFDNGKMWTFDNPPAEHFAKTYNFRPSEEWFEKVQKSALRFASYCSASFVSPDGLVMTNHHCARESGTAVQKAGEDLNNTGFYAPTPADERKVPGLYVDQLVQIADITDQVRQAMGSSKSESEQVALREQAFTKVKTEYGTKAGWQGLQLQTVTFYNGGKYSLYGFRRYNDVRLVMMPELQLGFFGGDPDNFTYPRYALDCSFFRVYDDSGQPLKTQYYFKFNPEGAREGEPVFVVGNPGSTQRQFTVSDLEYLRDSYIPVLLNLFRGKSQALQAYNQTAKSDSVLNDIFSLENSHKAYLGRLEGLNDPYLMARRRDFEKSFREAVRKNPKTQADENIWQQIDQLNTTRRKYAAENLVFQPSFTPAGFAVAQAMTLYAGQAGANAGAQSGNATGQADQLRKTILTAPKPESMQLEELQLAAHLNAAQTFLGPDDPYVKAALQGRTPHEAAKAIISSTKVYDPAFRQNLVEKGATGISAANDPLLKLAQQSVPRFQAATSNFGEVNTKLTALRARLGRLLYDIYGTSIPPDATFSLRISDGVVKGYEYNGTVAPPKTTFFGMYDRHYSFNGQYPWNLPEKWMNPPMELLKAPFNFVSTNDIIGGNSGSPMINRQGQAVGLIFDGNIESLPGAFIYEPIKNRTVSVHAGGMVAALRYIYKAERIVTELENAPGMEIRQPAGAGTPAAPASKPDRKPRKK